jgi:hypothetical protein
MSEAMELSFPFAGANISPMPEHGVVVIRLLQQRALGKPPAPTGHWTEMTPDQVEDLILNLQHALQQYRDVASGLGRDPTLQH